MTALFFVMGWTVMGFLALGPSLFVCWFFRDPDRVIPRDPHAIVSPADGRVVKVAREETNPYREGPCTKVSIFMNVFNVHVNRVPMGGVVEKVAYFPGKFINASLDKASEDNERNALVIKTPAGYSYTVVQIAGLIARRIVCRVGKGDHLERGRRYGMICFGSRLDLHLPLETEIAVALGDKVKAGSSVIGVMEQGV